MRRIQSRYFRRQNKLKYLGQGFWCLRSATDGIYDWSLHEFGKASTSVDPKRARNQPSLMAHPAPKAEERVAVGYT